MLKLIVGTKGSGKTKTMIDMIDKATKTTSGNIVVIEKCMKLTTEINHAARLVDVDEYGVVGADMLYGFVAGVLAGNYDITELFIDGILRIIDHDLEAADKVLKVLQQNSTRLVFLIISMKVQVKTVQKIIKHLTAKLTLIYNILMMDNLFWQTACLY